MYTYKQIVHLFLWTRSMCLPVLSGVAKVRKHLTARDVFHHHIQVWIVLHTQKATKLCISGGSRNF